MKRTLNFYGTAGNGQATLEIDRTGPIDLTPLFVDVFDQYIRQVAWNRRETDRKDSSDYSDEIVKALRPRYFPESTPDKSIFNFGVEELFAITLRNHKPEELSGFLKDNMINPGEFGNETLLKRIGSFDENYERVYFDRCENTCFFVVPLDDGLKPELIDEWIKPYTHKLTRDTVHTYYDNNPHARYDPSEDHKTFQKRLWRLELECEKRTTSKPYKCYRQDNVEKILRKNFGPKKIIRMYWGHSTKLDYFNIIHQYHLPTAHLEIVVKAISQDMPRDAI